MVDDARKAEIVTANLKAMGALLTEALRRAAEAHDYASAGERHAAIGTVSGVDVLLEDALALYRAALSIHRTR
jgi:hypothetical protein